MQYKTGSIHRPRHDADLLQKGHPTHSTLSLKWADLLSYLVLLLTFSPENVIRNDAADKDLSRIWFVSIALGLDRTKQGACSSCIRRLKATMHICPKRRPRKLSTSSKSVNGDGFQRLLGPRFVFKHSSKA